ncbi:putative xanthine dehydrogenase subunit D [Sporomusa carbonis]|uniref:xanthine dehydrogenase family protein molybdopterin-binding subunit n=1 Tax=Sporomusa carbonis TaxID=3076075 RepID=UPI003A622D41
MKLDNISIPVNKVDSREKTGGYAKYIADLRMEGMLYAKTLRSTRPRARILSVTIPPLPQGYCIVDRNDVPGKNRVKFLLDDQPFFAEDTVNYVGEPILLVVGPERQTIKEIMQGISVAYQDIEPVLELDQAEECPGGPIYGENNCFVEYAYAKGEPEAVFPAAADIIEEEYRTGYQEHAYLEPQGMIGVPEAGKVSVYGSMQCPYYVKNALIQGLGWDESRVRVVQVTVGGAFGGKEDYPSLIAGHAAFAAVKTGRPVAIVYERTEDMPFTTKRHPSVIKFKTALDRDGRIMAMDVSITLDGGAYAGISGVVLQRAMFNITGVYNIPSLRVNGKVLATNTVPNGAFRGFGAPQAFFALEMHMESLAKKLGIPSLAYKQRHMVKQGDLTATGGKFVHEVKLPEMIAIADEMSGYTAKTGSYPANREKPKGIGMSLFLHGCGFTGSGERDYIKAEVKLVRDGLSGKVAILTANVDMGQGLKTTLQKIVAKVLDLPLDSVVCENPDTDKVPDSGPTVASRSIMIVGKLLEEAALELKERWAEPGTVEVLKKYRHPARIKWDNATFQGDAYPAYSWGVNVVEVEVDPLTFEVDVTGVWTVFDVGVPIDEQIIRGQIEGGVLQGLGYAGMEVMNSKDGRVRQTSLTDYIIPTAMDFCTIQTKLVYNPYDEGPFGAKGAGELTLIGAAPAYAAAVANALGIHISHIPITPEYLMEVTDSASRSCDNSKRQADGAGDKSCEKAY